ncbi:glycosyltransferase family 2 protein [Ottowia thiooxydans]|uniref:glycosyltransferase family 2 protein n=1 Tax=Ottowia thiooxydans TaxID=219182 RepID=UPI000490F92D|nr:glycosyltransferase [Ottowia thiooxydans]
MTLKHEPLVSILVPTYNGAKYIRATLESVQSQTYTNWEVIVMDDASNDDTIDIVKSIAEPRIKIFDKNENLGAQGNWNRGLKQISGEYFKLLPQDDLLSTDCLEAQVRVFAEDKDQSISLVFSSRQVIGPNGDSRMIRGFGSSPSGRIPSKEIVRKSIRAGGNLVGEPGSGLMRAALVNKIGPYSSEFPYVIDLDYWIRALKHGDGFYIARPLTCFRVSLGAWSVKLGNKQVEDYRRLAEKVYRDGDSGISPLELKLGVLRSRINSWLRFAYYRFLT